ncbi:MAG: V-type ATPase subunit [Cellulosilyticaceae bacterium]
MSSFACYGAINTKLHARRRALLDTSDWNKMMDFKSVKEVIEFLKKKHGYKEIIPAANTEEMHRGELEVALNQYVVYEIEKILYYFSGPYKEFFKILLMKYEIDNLQLILRTIARGEEVVEVKEHFVYSAKYGVVSYDKLLASRSVIQFVENLKGTPYYEVLKTTTQEDLTTREFDMEMKLNILFYRLLIEKAKQLNEEDKKIAEDMIGTEIDYLNVQWIYRATKYFDISREEILIYSIPGGRKISFARLKGLIYTKTLEEFEKLAEKYLGYALFQQSDDISLEKAIDKRIYQLIKNLKDDENITMPLAYIYRMEIEVKELIAVTEGIRYELTKEEIKKFLVYTP